ncbi:MAG: trypsin-like peptidase domain-containing protein [Chitinophagaceae bacterium]|nr:trypsin-like peptidase domain-containing protein [Anaerolineae bacterium]
MLYRTLYGFVSIILLAITLPVTAQDSNDGLDIDRISRATVYIMQTRDFSNNDIICVGTGTIVNRSGLIVTNAHNTVSNANCPGQSLLIAISRNLNEPPILQYRAEVVQANPGLDLALLRITQDLDGRLIDPSTISLPFVELGDSSLVALDDTITVVGYPGVSNDSIETRRGTISGFIAEPSGGVRSWFKTDAVIPGTMTGGGVYDQNARLIGIPTTAPVTNLVADTTCLFLQDTNDDGLVNQADSCVPIGGFINAVRPVDFVRPLLRGASLGISVDEITAPSFQSAPSDDPQFSNLFFSTSVTEGMPVSVVNSLPTGTTSLFLFFDYVNLTEETVYELRVTTNDIPNPTFSLAPVRWSGGERGLWYIGNNEQVWPNGIYEFALFINGLASGRATILIGGAPEEVPSFSNLLFVLLDDDGNQFGNGYVLGTGNTVNATFLYNNMQPDMAWAAIWYYNDSEIYRTDDTWTRDSDGLGDTSIVSDILLPGRYRLTLYIEGKLSGLADFTVAGARDAAFSRVFSNARFVSANTPEEAIRATGISTFPSAISGIYALFDWEQLAPSTLWTLRWSVDDDVFFEETGPWRSLEMGQNYLLRLVGVNGIPDGTYKMEIYINSVRLASVEAQVGIGQLPIDIFAQATGIQLRGRVIDAETTEGISGVTFILISENFSVEDFTWSQDQIYAIATTDSLGQFQIDRLLQFGAPYSVMIAADGYLPISADGFEVDAETDNPLEIVIPLTRD